ncbi:MAG: ABC transporter permease [Alphaproteobacteria bacterium]|nr:ABC transporter permease [Alphaproteobacteria bacterium]
MRRKGSPWTGMATVLTKETIDHITSARMIVLELLIVITAIGAVFAAIGVMRTVTTEDPFLFLRLLTVAREPFPSFVSFLGFVVPIVAIALGFDAINAEYSRRTLSRILSQPIYRDALLVGKFLAALLTLSLTFVALWLLITGLGLITLGVPPSGEEVGRGLMFLLATIGYAGVWLAIAMMFSALFRAPATSAMASLALWLLFAVFWSIVAGLISQIGATPEDLVFGPTQQQVELEQWVTRLSPNTLYGEVTLAMLNPATRAFTMPTDAAVFDRIVLGQPLPFDQSVLLVWPQFTGLLAGVLILFTVVYLLFQRQEIRA